jgi:protein-tyrosine-phosphatase
MISMKVLFICRANVGRSQMGEAFFNALASKHSAISAGISAHTGPIADIVVSYMKEAGIDVSNAVGKRVTPEMASTADRIIVILEKHERDGVPDYIKNSGKAEYWPVPDGKGKPYEFHLKMRDDIRKRVEKLVSEMENRNK